MFIETWSMREPHPSGLQCVALHLVSDQVPDIAPRWGAPRQTTRYYEHSTPGGAQRRCSCSLHRELSHSFRSYPTSTLHTRSANCDDPIATSTNMPITSML